MSPRFPADKTDAQKSITAVEKSMNIMHNGPVPFQWIDEDGKSPLACYAPFSYTPEICEQFFILGKLAYGKNGVKPRNRECAILGMCSVLHAPFVVYSHLRIAAKVKLTKEQFDDGLAGKTPQGLSEEEEAAYRLGILFTKLTGRLDDETWADLNSKIDKTEIVGLIHVIGAYKWVALLEQVDGDFRDWTSLDKSAATVLQ